MNTLFPFSRAKVRFRSLTIIFFVLCIVGLNPVAIAVNSIPSSKPYSSSDRRTMGSIAEDFAIGIRITNQLKERGLSNTNSNFIRAVSNNRVVLLIGTVTSEDAKKSVTRIVANVRNVRHVLNELEVDPSGSEVDKAQDESLASRLKQALGNEPGINQGSLRIEVFRSKVFLMGIATEREAQTIASVARMLPGVLRVVRAFETISEADRLKITGEVSFEPVSKVSVDQPSRNSPPPCDTNLNSANWTDCFGTHTWDSGAKYVGNWKAGKPWGQGTINFLNGDRYIGELVDGYQHGKGDFTFLSGHRYVGDFQHNKFNGQGVYTYGDHRKYVGGFKDGKFHGKGTEVFSDGRPDLKGVWESDRFIGLDSHSERTVERTADAQTVRPSIDLTQARKKCGDLGFKQGTEKFGECVLRLSK